MLTRVPVQSSWTPVQWCLRTLTTPKRQRLFWQTEASSRLLVRFVVPWTAGKTVHSTARAARYCQRITASAFRILSSTLLHYAPTHRDTNMTELSMNEGGGEQTGENKFRTSIQQKMLLLLHHHLQCTKTGTEEWSPPTHTPISTHTPFPTNTYLRRKLNDDLPNSHEKLD